MDSQNYFSILCYITFRLWHIFILLFFAIMLMLNAQNFYYLCCYGLAKMLLLLCMFDVTFKKVTSIHVYTIIDTKTQKFSVTRMCLIGNLKITFAFGSNWNIKQTKWRLHTLEPLTSMNGH